MSENSSLKLPLYIREDGETCATICDGDRRPFITINRLDSLPAAHVLSMAEAIVTLLTAEEQESPEAGPIVVL
jgi:hypothetical protein